MALFASNGILSKDLPAALDRVREAIESTARSEGHHIDAVSSDRLRFDITTKRTALSWGTHLAITLEEAGGRTRMTVDYDNSPGSPKALMDKKKNTKSAQTFADQVEAAL